MLVILYFYLIYISQKKEKQIRQRKATFKSDVEIVTQALSVMETSTESDEPRNRDILDFLIDFVSTPTLPPVDTPRKEIQIEKFVNLETNNAPLNGHSFVSEDGGYVDLASDQMNLVTPKVSFSF